MSEQQSSNNDVPKSEQQGMGRRRFLETGAWTALGAVGITLLGTGGRFIVGDALKDQAAQWVSVGAITELVAGQVHKATYTLRRKDAWRTVEEKGLLYIFSQDGTTYTALSAICTHLGCNVHFEEETGGFRCPCHDAHFSQAGEVVSGPPRRALARLETKLENGELLVLV
ncbi:MAG: Rieske (2Fe-2S) protein [Caldilineaceae bacterium]